MNCGSYTNDQSKSRVLSGTSSTSLTTIITHANSICGCRDFTTVCLCVCFSAWYHKNRCSKTLHTYVLWWDLEVHLFWGQKVEDQGHVTKTLPAWVFALLWVLASSYFQFLLDQPSFPRLVQCPNSKSLRSVEELCTAVLSMICCVSNLIRLSFLFYVLWTLILLLNHCVCRSPIVCFSFKYSEKYFSYHSCVLMYDIIINK